MGAINNTNFNEYSKAAQEESENKVENSEKKED